MTQIQPRFGEAIKLSYENAESKKSEGDKKPGFDPQDFANMFMDSMDSGEARRSVKQLVEYSGQKASFVTSFDPTTHKATDYILVDGPNQDTYTQAKNLEAKMRDASTDPNDYGYHGGCFGGGYDEQPDPVKDALGYVLPALNLITGSEETLAVQHGKFGKIANEDEIKAKIGIS